MNLNKLEKFLKENNQPKFRLEQIKKAIYQDGASSFLEISTISKDLRDLLDKKLNILSFGVEKVLVSDPARNATHSVAGGDKRSMKALLRLSDNNYIETVLLSPRPARNATPARNDVAISGEHSVAGGPETWTACISSQVGCPLRCEFCATGKGGFKRNLTAEEITDQVLFWKQYLKFLSFDSSPKGRGGILNNIVYMGMGEPFLNWENVKKSVEDLVNPKMFEIGSRSISISTAGIEGGIEKFLDEFPQVNLAISLHFADNEIRSKFMPANRAYDLRDIKKDLQNYFQKSKRKVFMEYIMFEGLNDSLDDAKKLVDYLKSIGNSYLLHVNLISYNETSGKFKSSSKEKIEKFKNHLLQNKINATIRKSLGTEIAGACGQLAGK